MTGNGMKRHGFEPNSRKQRAIVALLSKKSVNQAAQEAGISVRTLWRWLQNPDFQAAYRQTQRQVVEQALTALQQATGQAVETLRRNLDCERASVEVRAAEIILSQALQAMELSEYELRIRRLEEIVEGGGAYEINREED